MLCNGGKEHTQSRPPRALFLLHNGALVGDAAICSGAYPTRLQGERCPLSDAGRMPPPVRLDEVAVRRTPNLGSVGEWAPPCCIEQLGALRAWRPAEHPTHPVSIEGLRLFKCRQMFMLVVPGLMDSSADQPPSAPAM